MKCSLVRPYRFILHFLYLADYSIEIEIIFWWFEFFEFDAHIKTKFALGVLKPKL